MATDATTRAAIIEVLTEFQAAVAAQDVDRLLAQFAPDGEAVSIGTGAAEWHVGTDAMREGLERDFADASPFTVDFAPPIISSAGDVAWLAAGFNGRSMIDGVEVRLHGRLTAVLIQRNGRWVLVQTHTSVPFGETPSSTPS
jgi:ketosteroid isomerase-like protein